MRFIWFLLLLAGSVAAQRPALIPYRKGELWGFCDSTRKVRIPCTFSDARPFSNGLAPVKKNGGWGYIDTKGNWVLEPQYDFLYPMTEYGFAIVSKKGKEGLVDRQGKEVLPAQYKGLSFGEGFATVENNDYTYSVLRFDRQLVIPPTSTYLTGVRNGRIRIQEKGKYGFADRSGKTVIPCRYDETGAFFREGMVPVQTNGKWGYIDSTGREVTPFIYDKADLFANGRAAVRRDGKWGFVDASGKEVIPPTYAEVRSFSRHGGKTRALVAQMEGTMWRIIDENGKKIRDLAVLRPTDFRDGYLSGQGLKTMLIIDMDGKTVAEPAYTGLKSLGGGFFVAWAGDVGALHGPTGPVTKTDYRKIGTNEDGLFEVDYFGKKGYIDTKGVEYWEN